MSPSMIGWSLFRKSKYMAPTCGCAVSRVPPQTAQAAGASIAPIATPRSTALRTAAFRLISAPSRLGRRAARATSRRPSWTCQSGLGCPRRTSVDSRAVDEAWLEEVSEWLRIPSVSADPAHADDVRRAGEWLCERVRGAGGTCELVDWHGKWLAVGELRASEGADRAPTILCYGHFDVQPPAPLDLWESPPFEPTVRDEWLYARGVADDKGQLYTLLKAAELLARDGALPVNLRFACDGEEESGGHSIVEFLEDDERGADACVIFDSDMIARGRPSFNVATRGLCYFHVRVRTGSRDLHSGMYGGAALNALHVLGTALAAVQPVDGRLPEALREGVTPP